MGNILVFGGTTEGRLLAEYLEARKQKAYICVATDYGKEVLRKTRYCKIIVGRKTQDEMKAWIQAHHIDLIVDATHPYAVEVSQNIKQAAAHCQVTYYRIIRDLGTRVKGAMYFSTLTQMKDYLSQQKENFISTLGYKELIWMKDIEGVYERGFARILPGNSKEKLQALCEEIGFCRTHIVEARGPFSVEDNEKILLQCDAKFCLTKETGKEGGFMEKVIATQNMGVKLLVLERPKESNGMTLEECFTLIP